MTRLAGMLAVLAALLIAAAPASAAKYADKSGRLTVPVFGVADDAGEFAASPLFAQLKGNAARKIINWWQFLPDRRDAMCDRIHPVRVNQLRAKNKQPMLAGTELAEERERCKAIWRSRAADAVAWCQRVGGLGYRLVTLGNLIWRYGVSQRDVAAGVVPPGTGTIAAPSKADIQRGVESMLKACPQANRWANMNESNFPSWESVELPLPPKQRPGSRKKAQKAYARDYKAWTAASIKLNLRYYKAIRKTLGLAGRSDPVAAISIVVRDQQQALGLMDEIKRQTKRQRIDAIAMSTYPQVQGLKAPAHGARVPSYPKDLRDILVRRPKRSRVWFTELSGYYRKQQDWPSDPVRQAKATRNIVSLVEYWARKGVVDSLFWYQWTENVTNPWDSALLGADGKVRPAFDVLRAARR